MSGEKMFPTDTAFTHPEESIWVMERNMMQLRHARWHKQRCPLVELIQEAPKPDQGLLPNRLEITGFCENS